MKKKKVKRFKKKRKSYFLTLLAIVVLWILTFLVIIFIDPSTFLAIPLFFSLLFLAILFTLSSIFANSFRGLIYSLSIISFLILRYFGIGHILNLLLIAAATISIDLFITKKSG